MATIHLVSHTHWDREWYLPYQVFRLKLVRLVDNLLDLLASDPGYQYFMLDGQTIVLDDYLQMRPEREAQIRALVQAGRLLIGPWFVLTDEFLASPEAIIRNLLHGDRSARRFGPKMQVGYIPDPFGHIGQMPQILQGFGIQVASLQRGLSDEPCELWWQAPDGSRVFTAYLRDGYGNAALLPASDPDVFVSEICRLRDSLLSHSASTHALLMFGTDHTEPSPLTSAAIDYAKQHLEGDTFLHTTLPAYIDAVRAQLFEDGSRASKISEIPTVTGELRSSKRHHLLPGVLSARVWIKQRDHDCETLLEKWAEPFSTFASLIAGPPGVDTASGQPAVHLAHPEEILRQAWRLLMECHPHDSICGCSIDQVHAEMRPRFDQVEQVGEEITRQSLERLSAAIDTRPALPGDVFSSVVVFNPLAFPRTDLARVSLFIPAGPGSYAVVDESGQSMPFWLGETERRAVAYFSWERQSLLALLSEGMESKISGIDLRQGLFNGMAVQDVNFHRQDEVLYVYVILSESGKPNPAALSSGLVYVLQALEDATLATIILQASVNTTELYFIARNVPSLGYKTFWLQPLPTTQATSPATHPSDRIENEYFLVTASSKDGTLAITDKRSGLVYTSLNRFVDGGDSGDEYNYCPPFEDKQVQAGIYSIRTTASPAKQSIEINLTLQAPAGLSPDRKARSSESVVIPIRTRASLIPGVARLDILTEVDNLARDHRLRVHFPAPFSPHQVLTDGHFELVERHLGLPPHDPAWAEGPRPEQPQRLFTTVAGADADLLVANRGLREVEVFARPDGNAEIALTLLRCVGWLSRDDFPARKGQAGPSLPTPGAQMLGKSLFEYSLVPYSFSGNEGSARSAALAAYQQAYAFNASLRAVAATLHPGQLPAAGNFLQVSPASFVLSAIKTAEDGSGWIVRGYNLGPDPLHVSLKPSVPFKRAWRTNLAEAEESELTPLPDGSLEFDVRGHEIATLKFTG